MRILPLIALFFALDAAAVPLEIPHQGRLLDTAGTPLEGAHDLGFALYDTSAGGSPLWSATISAELDNGYYSVALGPVDADQIDGSLYLGITVDGGAELPGRLPLQSVPFAITAGSVRGGVVDATEIRVNGTTVIDASGTVLGGSDTLAGLGCSDGEIPRYEGTGWACAAPSDHEHDAADLTTGTLSLDLIPIGTGADTVAAGDHGHAAADVGALPIEGGTLSGALAGTDGDFSGTLSGALVLVGDGASAACGSGTAGALRWTGKALELCDGKTWLALRVAGTNGTTKDTAGESCKALLAADATLPSGKYWVDPDLGDSGNATEVWCDMKTDGGGWTVIVNNDNTDAEPSGCVARIATAGPMACGSVGATSDFSALAAGMEFTEAVFAAYSGTFSLTSYQYMKFTSPQTIPSTTGAWFRKADQYNQTLTGLGSAPKIYCTWSGRNRIESFGNEVPRGASAFGSQLVTVFSGSATLDDAQMSFTDNDVHSTGQLKGLDDFQDGWGCGEEWQPLADKGKSSLFMLR